MRLNLQPRAEKPSVPDKPTGIKSSDHPSSRPVVAEKPVLRPSNAADSSVEGKLVTTKNPSTFLNLDFPI